MESLQLAQMLADISDLSAADQKAAKAIVSANKTLPNNPGQPQDAQGQLQPPASALQRSSPSASGTRFDKFGRKILTPPGMSRSNSAGPTSQAPSTPGTPREPDDDVHQASSLMTLYEIRNKLKQQDSTGLKKAREQIDQLIAKNKQKQQGEGQEVGQRPRPMSRTYTFPKGEQTPGSSETK